MADLPNAPATRREQFLNAVATGNVDDLPNPITREEMYLDFIAENASSKEGVTPAQVRSIIAEQTDDALSSTSENAVQNKVINTALNNKADINDIPTKTSDLTNDSSYIADNNYVHTDNNYTTAEKSKLEGIASGAEVNVQSDWNVTTTTSDAYIKNKPSSLPANGGNAATVGGLGTESIIKYKEYEMWTENTKDANSVIAMGIYNSTNWTNAPYARGTLVVMNDLNNEANDWGHGVQYFIPAGFSNVIYSRSYQRYGPEADPEFDNFWYKSFTTGNCVISGDDNSFSYTDPSGLLIQGGVYTIPKANTSTSVTFNAAYSHNPLFHIDIYEVSSKISNYGLSALISTGFTINGLTAGSLDKTARWITIGKAR